MSDPDGRDDTDSGDHDVGGIDRSTGDDRSTGEESPRTTDQREPDPEQPGKDPAGGDDRRTTTRDDRGRSDGTSPRADPPDESTRVVSEDRRRNVSLVGGIVALIGAWVALSVLLYESGTATTWNNVIVGVAVFLAAGYNYARLAGDSPSSVGVATLIALLGIWLVVAPLAFEMTGGAFWNTITSGLLVAALAGYNAYEARRARTVVGDRAETG